MFFIHRILILKIDHPTVHFLYRHFQYFVCKFAESFGKSVHCEEVASFFAKD
tara:strand:+ start:358 stop:513 length:156 start_codon:yes stop_codon:yes gene_type:complete